MNTRVAWVLLLTYAVLLAVGCFAMWISVWVLGSMDMRSPPVPPTTPASSSEKDYLEYSTVVPRLTRFNYGYRHSKEPSEEYRNFVDATAYYASYTKDPRLYVVIPSGVTVLVSGVMVLAGMCSRKIFATSVGLYSSLGLWILTLLMSIVYQSISWKRDDFFLSTVGWVLGIQIGLLVLLPIQMVLAMWELRRQKAGWPCLYFSRVITVETFLLVVRVTLGIYAIIFLWDSSLIDGLRNTSDGYSFWDSPQVRVPRYFVYPCVVAAAYGVIVSIEGTLSHFSGKVHGKLMACTALMSAICYGGLAVITSPVFLMTILGQNSMRGGLYLMIFAILLSIVNFIHAFTCMIFPSGIRTPPRFIKKIAEELSSFDVSRLNLNGLASSAAVTHCIEFLKIQPSLNTKVDLVSLTVSIITVILVSIGMDYPYGVKWSPIMMLCGNVAILFRTIPTLVAEKFCHQTFVLPDVIRALHFFLENITLFIGAIGSCISSWNSVHVAAAVINILYVIGMGIFAFVMYKMQKNTEITGVSEDTKVLTESMPEDEQVHGSWPEGGQIINGLEQGSLSQSYA